MLNVEPSRDYDRPNKPCEVFSVIGPDARHELLRCMSERTYAAGSMLFEQDQAHTHTFFLCHGLVRTYYLSPCAREITLAYWSRNDVIGGPDFLTRTPHIWSAVAIKATAARIIAAEDLDRLVRAHADLAYYINRTLTFKVHWLSGLLQVMGTGSVTDRLAHMLLKLGDLYGIQTQDGIVITERFSHEQLGNMVGASRPWTTMTLSRLQCAGVISIKQHRIVLHDPDVLRRVIASGGLDNDPT